MKHACFVFIVSVMAIPCIGQHANGAFFASASGIDRISVVKNSVEVPTSHEKEYWPLYEKYVLKIENISRGSMQALHELAKADKNVNDEEALHLATNLLDLRWQELQIRKEYYRTIGSAMNGIVALQFVQTESLLDLMETADIYNQTQWKKYRFLPTAVTPERKTEMKYNLIAAAVSLRPEQAKEFYQIYARYEEECDALLGEQYDLYNLYAGEASDYTPGLAKRLGYDLLNVIERELKLKDKYFKQMTEKVGPVLASRFLTWEDYNSVVNKMYAMAE